MNPFHKINDLLYLAVLHGAEVGDLHGISLRSARAESADFLRVCSFALRLIAKHDDRRLRRIITHNRFIADHSLPNGAYSGQYKHRINVTIIDFEYDLDWGDDLSHAAYFAGVLVHEATHGELRNKGIKTTKKNRIQIERICVAEQNRFLCRLDSEQVRLGRDLIQPFDPKRWDASWNSSRFERALRHFKRIYSNWKRTNESSEPPTHPELKPK